MWRNYLSAALNNLGRSKLHSAINISGLAVGLAAALLIALYVRDEFSYDQAVPQSERIFRLSTDIKGAQTKSLDIADASLTPAIELDFPEVESAVRLYPGHGYLRSGDNTIWADFRRADPGLFTMFPPRVIAGDPNAALKHPDMLVITRNFARALFGREDVVGRAIELRLNDTSTFHIGAVIENLPSNTHFSYDVVASTVGDAHGQDASNALTYVRLRKGSDAAKVRASLPEFLRRHLSHLVDGQPAWKRLDLKLTALRDIHFLPPTQSDMNPPSDRRTVGALIGIALLTLLVASSGFVSMMTARGARRATEVGVRKALGATRRQIAMQFLGESLLYAGLSLVVAMIAVELLLPSFRGFLHRDIAFNYLREPGLGAAILLTWLVVSLAAGVYPALVLSRFRPGTVLKGTLSLPGGPGRLRSVMVTLQFSLLVGLVVATLTIQRQTHFAIEERLRVPGEQIFVMRASCVRQAFHEVARQIPGVLAAACTSNAALGTDTGAAFFRRLDGSALAINAGVTDGALFDVFGVKPIAGRLFDDQHGEDNVLRTAGETKNPSIILNESAARELGYARPADAVGQFQTWGRQGNDQDGRFKMFDRQPSQIVGVVPDFSVGSIRSLIQPAAYYIAPQDSFALVLKLDGRRIPETLQAIQSAWKATSEGRPMVGARFVSQILDSQYADIQRQGRLFEAFSAISIAVAVLGILGLALYTAERRTREIGIRKCMGASRRDILRFISWQFVRPVVLANLIAWPVAWLLMRRWLSGFAYHVDLTPESFLVASLLALCIALLTVSGHAWMVSRSRPVDALRYE